MSDAAMLNSTDIPPTSFVPKPHLWLERVSIALIGALVFGLAWWGLDKYSASRQYWANQNTTITAIVNVLNYNLQQGRIVMPPQAQTQPPSPPASTDPPPASTSTNVQPPKKK